MKISVCVLAMILISAYSFSQQEYATDKSNGCKYYTGNAEKRSIEWTGECVDGFISGNGVLKVYENEELIYTYEGGTLSGDLHGKGIIRYESGHKFDGIFNKGDKEGAGRFDYADGSYYEGNYAAGLIEGQGTYAWANGQNYCGEWKAQKYHGAGTFTWADGGTIKTNWISGLPNGYAEIHMATGDSYIGNIKGLNKDNGWIFLEDGQGTYNWANGDKYAGEWKDGQKHGHGEFNDEFNTYIGQWDYGFKQGYGEETCHIESINSTYKGNWKDGLKSGHGVEISYGGSVRYDGNWKWDSYNGEGNYKWFSHEYNGSFKMNLKDGAGTYISPNGDTLKGNWIDNAYQQSIIKNVYVDSRDSKKYEIVTIGNQTWFAENISYVPTDIEVYRHPADSSQIAYDWETAKSICPTGWHLPTVVESEILKIVCDNIYDGKNLKSDHDWIDDGNGNDTYEFNILPFAVINKDRNLRGSKDYGSESSIWLKDTREETPDQAVWYFTVKKYTLTSNTVDSEFNFIRCVKD